MPRVGSHLHVPRHRHRSLLPSRVLKLNRGPEFTTLPHVWCHHGRAFSLLCTREYDEAAHIDQRLKSSHSSVLFHWPQDLHGLNDEPLVCFSRNGNPPLGCAAAYSRRGTSGSIAPLYISRRRKCERRANFSSGRLLHW